MKNELIQTSLFDPVIPYIQSIEANIATGRYHLQILITDELKLDINELKKYFIDAEFCLSENGGKYLCGELLSPELGAYLYHARLHCPRYVMYIGYTPSFKIPD